MNYTAIAASAWQAAADEQTAARCHQWITALICRRTRGAARDMNISQDTRDKLSAAWMVYETIRAHDAQKARTLRKRYGYRRFLDAGAMMARYDITPLEVAEHIESQLSNAAMQHAMIDAHDPQPEWWRKLYSVNAMAEKIATAYDVPDATRARLDKVLIELRGILAEINVQ